LQQKTKATATTRNKAQCEMQHQKKTNATKKKYLLQQ